MIDVKCLNAEMRLKGDIRLAAGNLSLLATTLPLVVFDEFD